MALRGQRYTLTQLNTLLGGWVNDAADTRWTSAEKNSAIQSAILAARGNWEEERIDSSNTYDDETYRYDLPPACHRVLAVQFEPNDSDYPRYEISPGQWGVEGNELVFNYSYTNYDGHTMYIIYTALPTNLLTLSGVDGVIASVTATALTSAASTFITNLTLIGDAVIITENNYAGNGTYYVKSVDSETQLTLDKAPGAAATALNFTVGQYTDMPLTYIKYASMAELYEMSFRNAPGLEIDSNIKMATYYRQLADNEIRKFSRRSSTHRSY